MNPENDLFEDDIFDYQDEQAQYDDQRAEDAMARERSRCEFMDSLDESGYWA